MLQTFSSDFQPRRSGTANTRAASISYCSEVGEGPSNAWNTHLILGLAAINADDEANDDVDPRFAVSDGVDDGADVLWREYCCELQRHPPSKCSHAHRPIYIIAAHPHVHAPTRIHTRIHTCAHTCIYTHTRTLAHAHTRTSNSVGVGGVFAIATTCWHGSVSYQCFGKASCKVCAWGTSQLQISAGQQAQYQPQAQQMTDSVYQ